jgi:hypothetical protein
MRRPAARPRTPAALLRVDEKLLRMDEKLLRMDAKLLRMDAKARRRDGDSQNSDALSKPRPARADDLCSASAAARGRGSEFRASTLVLKGQGLMGTYPTSPRAACSHASLLARTPAEIPPRGSSSLTAAQIRS